MRADFLRIRAGTVNSTANSPSMASSPVIGSFSVPNKAVPSPALGAVMQRTGSSRGRQNSTNSVLQVGQSSAAVTSHSNGNGNKHGSGDSDKPVNNRLISDNKVTKDETTAAESERPTRTNDRGVKREDSLTAKPRPPSITTSTRNGGKASKTATPVSTSFPESHRPRSGRHISATQHNLDQPVKRSHKKGAGIAAQAAAAAAAKAKASQKGDEDDSIQGDEEEDGGEEEPRYCYCNQFSFGDMIACDWPGCEKEWFHLECVGLSKAPGGKGKSIRHRTERILVLTMLQLNGTAMIARRR